MNMNDLEYMRQWLLENPEEVEPEFVLSDDIMELAQSIDLPSKGEK